MSGFRAPTQEQVEAALRRIPTFQLRRVFFEALANPLWIQPLQKAGVFKNPPEPRVDEKVLVREAFWPEIDYLTRMAPLAPTEVVDVLLTLEMSKNSWVRRGVFEIGASIPADQAARLQPLVEAWKKELGWRTDPHSLTGLLRNLLAGGYTKFGRSLANALFRPESTTDKKGDPSTGLEAYWYEQELPSIVEALGPDALNVVMPWLEQWEIAAGRFGKKTDITTLGRSDIAHADDTYESIEQSLIDAIRDAAVKSFGVDPLPTAKQFLSRPMILLRKIAMYSATRALTDRPQTEEPQDLVAAAKSLLEDSVSSDHACRVEFADLYIALREQDESVEAILHTVIANGPYGSHDQLLERLGRRENQDQPLEEVAQEYVANWTQRLLATIGAEFLPKDLADVLAELDKNDGPIQLPRDPDFKFTSWTGPSSPVTLEELKAMDPAEITTQLETWRAGDSWMAPTHEGMARTVSELLASKPEALKGVTNLTTRLRPTYLRSILSGWTAALKNEVALDWADILILVEQVLEHADKSEIPPEGGDFDDDQDFVNAKQAAINLLTEAAKPSNKPALSPAASETVARLLTGSFADGKAWERYATREINETTDPLTISLNGTWPIALRGLIYLASHGETTPWFGEVVTTLENELQRDDEVGASYAVIGEGLARLFNNAPNWLNEHVAELFGSENEISRAQQIALTTALATHRTHPLILELLRGPLTAAMNLDEPIAMGWKGQSDALQLIGHWIITCLIWGEITLDDPLVEQFFGVVSPEIRGAAIGHIAWSFLQSDKVDADIRARLEELWDARVAHIQEDAEDSEELKDFYWFVRSGKFAPEWWLPRLKQAAELNSALNTHGMIGEQLAAAAPLAPRDALDALRLLMNREDEFGTNNYDLSENAAPAVIAAAMQSDDKTLVKEAVAFMNELGALGHVNLEDRVKQFLN